MKQLFYLLIISPVLGGCLNNTDKNNIDNNQVVESSAPINPIPPIDTANFTTIEWIDSAKHLGTIKQGELMKLEYRFKNTGSKPLVITSVRPACGCTVADYPKQPLSPGQEGVIKAEFDSKGKEGFQSKSITVDANTKQSFTLWFDLTINKN